MSTCTYSPTGAPAPYVVHRFVADHFPTPWDVHCWCTQLTNQHNIPFKVLRNGKVLGLVCPDGAVAPRCITQASGNFRFLRTEPAPAFEGSEGDIASISLRLSYAISRRNASGKKYTQSPWDTYGRLKKDMAAHFLAYLEQQTGLTGLVQAHVKVGLQAVALVGPQDRQRKVWLTSVADLGIRARIADIGKFRALAYQAIGNHRSYGLGSVSCDALEITPAPMQEHLQLT